MCSQSKTIDVLWSYNIELAVNSLFVHTQIYRPSHVNVEALYLRERFAQINGSVRFYYISPYHIAMAILYFQTYHPLCIHFPSILDMTKATKMNGHKTCVSIKIRN